MHYIIVFEKLRFHPPTRKQKAGVLKHLLAYFPAAPRGFAARSRVHARLASLAQIGELARRLKISCPLLSDTCGRWAKPNWNNVDVWTRPMNVWCYLWKSSATCHHKKFKNIVYSSRVWQICFNNWKESSKKKKKQRLENYNHGFVKIPSTVLRA